MTAVQLGTVLDRPLPQNPDAERAVRRIPVVEDSRPVGVLSIGDMALERDERSALADISAQPPNR